MNLFPVTVVDNFYTDVNSVREFALSLPYHNNNGKYPGKRTELLHLVDQNFFDQFSKKIMSLYYDIVNTEITWQIATSFQYIEPFHEEKNHPYNGGWIHTDADSVFAGVIFLNPNPDPDSGTRIYELKETNKIEKLISNIESEIQYETRFPFYEHGNAPDNYIEMYLEHKNKYNETINVKNVYNRLISFDSAVPHGVETYHCNGEPRLTQVFFVQKLNTDSTPLTRMNCY